MRHLESQRAVAVESEGAAVEDQLVLAAALVDIDERQARLDHAGERHLLADLGLALPIGRAVGRDENFGTGLGQAFADLLVPDVLADRQTEPHAAEADGAGQRADVEDAQLVEDAVIGELDLVAQRLDLAAVDERDGVVALVLARPRRADDDARAAIGGLGGQRLDRPAAGVLEGRLENEVFRRIAGDEQLGEDQQVCPGSGGLRAGFAGFLQIPVDVADHAIELAGGDADRVGEVRCHGRRCSPAADGGQSASAFQPAFARRRSPGMIRRAPSGMRGGGQTWLRPLRLAA